MKQFKHYIAIAAILVSAGASAEVAQNPIADTPMGRIEGIYTDYGKVAEYLGIPYAKAPVGNKRWTLPELVNPWDTVMLAQKFGPMSAQERVFNPTSLYGKEFYADLDATPKGSEDCLQLNVWTPAHVTPGKKLPVVLWIHGGGFNHGWSHEITMDGTEFAKRGVILVTANYRVGLPGFMAHPLLSAESPTGVSGNYALYDLGVALEWIKKNISAMNGDPDNITVMGQSAGAACVKDLIASPLTSPLISKAIIQSSGGPFGFTKADAEKLGKEMMDWAGIKTLDQMRALSTFQLDSIQKAYQKATKDPGRFFPFADGVFLPEDFDDANARGHLKEMPVMIGYTKDDMPRIPGKTELFLHTHDSIGSKAPVYAYKFNRSLPGDDAGAFHSSELWYMFGTLDRAWRPMTSGDFELSRRMLDYWTNFAKYGNPNGKKEGAWLPYSEKQPYYQILDVIED